MSLVDNNTSVQNINISSNDNINCQDQATTTLHCNKNTFTKTISDLQNINQTLLAPDSPSKIVSSKPNNSTSQVKEIEGQLYIKTKQNKQMNSENFYKQDRHYFIMTEGGTPIYSRYGDKMENCSIMATFSAIITKFTIFNTDKNTFNKLNFISDNNCTIVFLKKGGMILIALSKWQDPWSFLYSQLDWLYYQILSVVTAERMPWLIENPSSLGSVLEDTDQLLEQMWDYTSKTLVSLLSAYKVLPIENRKKWNEIWNNHWGDALMCWLVSHSANEVIAISRRSDCFVWVQNDIILIQNLVLHSDSLRSTESWVPICWPGICADGFVQWYSNFTSNENFGIIYITEKQENKFFLKLSDESQQIIEDVKAKGLMVHIQKSWTVRIESRDENEVTNEKIEEFMTFLFKNTDTIRPQSKHSHSDESAINNNNTIDNQDHYNSPIDIDKGQIPILLPLVSFPQHSSTFSDSVYKSKDILKDPLWQVKYAIFKNKIYNQFFSINFNAFDSITKENKEIYKIYNKLHDMYTSQVNKWINTNSFFHYQKDSKYTHAIFASENYMWMVTFNIFKSFDEIHDVIKELIKLVKHYENNFFINIK